MKVNVEKAVCALVALGFSGLVNAAEVTVDFANETGPVKAVNGVGQPPMIGGPGNYYMFHYLKQAGIPYSRLHDVGGAYGQMRYVDVPNIFRNFEADENDPKNYDFTYTDDLLKALVANNVEPFFRLGVTIENAVEKGFPGYRCDPPKDYAKWARVCERIIAHYTEGWADGYTWNIAYWEIWNEPDNMPEPERNPLWRAPWSEYLKFYGIVAPRLKKRFPRLKIGGYGSCGFYAGVGAGQVKAANSSPRLDYFITCAEEFLAAAKEKGWPLDFFSFHSYSAPEAAIRQVRYADDLLNRYGFTADRTERVYNEWLPYVGHKNLGTALQAAGIAAELIELQNGPCDVACIYDARCGIGNYSPLFNALTYEPHKAYYAFTAFNELRKCGRAVKVDVKDAPKGFHVTAATGFDGSAVLFANDSDKAVPLAADFGKTPKEVRLTDASHTDAVVPLPAALPPRSFVVVLFAGAPDATADIQKRIDDAFRAGGGRVSVAKGTHRVRGLRLRSNVELHLESGAVLLASRDPEDYVGVMRRDLVEPVPAAFFTEAAAPFKGRKPSRSNTPGSRWNNAVIRLYRAKNASITGEPGSVIDGGNSFDLQGEEGYRGVHGVSAVACENLTLSGYTIRRTGNWAHRIMDSSNVRVTGLTVQGGHDGMDFHGCRNVEISKCKIHSGDDCVAGVLNEGLHLTDCDLSSSCSIFRLGGNGLVLENSTAHGPCEWPFRYLLPSHAKRSGLDGLPGCSRYNTISFFTHFGSVLDERPGDVVIRNFTVTDVDKLVHYNRSGNERWQHGPGLGRISFENVKVSGLKQPAVAYSPSTTSTALAMKACEIGFRERPKAFLLGANVETVRLDGVKITGVDGPLFLQWGDKKPAFDANAYEGPKPEAVPAEGKFTCRPI